MKKMKTMTEGVIWKQLLFFPCIFLLLFSDPEFPALSLPAFPLIPVYFYLCIAGSHTGL